MGRHAAANQGDKNTEGDQVTQTGRDLAEFAQLQTQAPFKQNQGYAEGYDHFQPHPQFLGMQQAEPVLKPRADPPNINRKIMLGNLGIAPPGLEQVTPAKYGGEHNFGSVSSKGSIHRPAIDSGDL